MNSAGHRALRIRAQYAPGVDLRPALGSKNVMAEKPLCVHKTRLLSAKILHKNEPASKFYLKWRNNASNMSIYKGMSKFASL